MARIISIVNQKGGTGKSACTANLAVGLAQKNMKVLIVDADPQSDVSAGFGYRDCDDSNETLTVLMDAVMKDEDIPSDCYIRHQAEGIDIICSNIGLAGTEIQLVNAMSREYVLPEVLHQAAEESVQAWLPDAFDELQMDVSGTFLEDLDEQNQKVEFRELMTNSVWYVLLNRCGLDVQEYLDAEDFRHITDFNQLKVMGHLGSSVNEISRPVLMQIGRYVLDDLEKDLKTVAKEKKVAYNKFNTLIRESETKNTEDREKNKEETEHERDHLQPERRVSDSRYQPGRDKRNNREVRNDEERVSEKLQGSQVQHSDTAEPSGQSSDGDRQSGKTESRQPDERTSRERSGTRQDGRHNGMDQTHEPDQSTGRGTGDPGDYLQLSLFPTEEEQFGEIRKAAAALEQPAAFLISDEVVDHILRTGSGQKNTLFHITARLIEGLDNEEMQSFLKDEYGTGGKGFTIDNQKISIWWTMAGWQRRACPRNDYFLRLGRRKWSGWIIRPYGYCSKGRKRQGLYGRGQLRRQLPSQ